METNTNTPNRKKQMQKRQQQQLNNKTNKQTKQLKIILYLLHSSTLNTSEQLNYNDIRMKIESTQNRRITVHFQFY